jgi:hypothetical protein
MLPSVMASPIPARLLCALVLLAAEPVRAERVDRVLSVLGERVVTASDLALEQVLAARDPSVVPALRRADVAALEDQRRIRGHAGQVRLYQPGRRALDNRHADLRRTFEAPGAWEGFLADWGLTEESVQALVLNRMVVEITVLRTLGAPETGAEAAWVVRYETWMAGLRADLEPHRPEMLE